MKAAERLRDTVATRINDDEPARAIADAVVAIATRSAEAGRESVAITDLMCGVRNQNLGAFLLGTWNVPCWTLLCDSDRLRVVRMLTDEGFRVLDNHSSLHVHW